MRDEIYKTVRGYVRNLIIESNDDAYYIISVIRVDRIRIKDYLRNQGYDALKFEFSSV